MNIRNFPLIKANNKIGNVPNINNDCTLIPVVSDSQFING